MRIILASASPRRQEMLKALFPDLIVYPANINEDLFPFVSDYPSAIAEAKALHVARIFPDDLIVAADTIVLFENRLFLKPLDRADAKRMLWQLRGNRHEVRTAVTLNAKGQTISFLASTFVTFRAFTEAELEAYLDTNEFAGKSGSYGIQGAAGDFVSKIEGDINNVVGLPLEALIIKINELKTAIAE